MKKQKMDNKLFITIAIPAYKARFLNRAIESVLAQKYLHFELLIVNDASPEDIHSIVRTYTDTRIKYFTNECNNGGENVVDNWNKCLRLAQGDYFVLMGDDDEMKDNYLSEFIKLINKYPDLDIYHCRSFIIDENSNPIRLTASWPEFESLYENIWHRINFLREQFISDFVYKTSTLKSNGGFLKLPLAWMSDDISSYIAIGDKGIAHTQEAVFCYRKNSLSISTSGNIELKLRASKEGIDWLHSFLKNRKENNVNAIFLQEIFSGLSEYRRRTNKLSIYNARKNKKISLLLRLFFVRHKYIFSFKDYLEGVLGKI